MAGSPLAPAPLTGPVILGSGAFPPPLAVPLTGAVALTLHGTTALPTSPNQGISNSFEGLPDLPVTRFELTLTGGRGSLLKAVVATVDRYTPGCGQLRNRYDVCR